MDYVLEIAGVSQQVKRGSLRLVRLANFRKTLEAIILSTDGSYIPAEAAVARLKEAGTTIFLGPIQHTLVSGLAGEPNTPLETQIDCVDSNAIADDLYLRDTFPGGTVKQFLQWVIDTYLTARSITLDPSQDDGPTIPALAYTYQSNRRISDGLADVAKIAAGRIWRINDSLQLSMLDPIALPAPFDLAEGDQHVVGDFTADITSEGYANRVIVAGTASEVLGQKDTFTGTGSATVFTLSLKNIAAPGGADVPVAGGVWYDNGVNAPVFETAGLSAATWIWDPATNAFTDTGTGTGGYRSFPIAAGKQAYCIYNGMPEALATANDVAEQTAKGFVKELVITSNLTDPTALQALADATLAQHVLLPITGKYETDDVGLDSGQVQGVNLPSRGAVGTFLLTQVETHDDPQSMEADETPRLRHHVTCIEILAGSPSASDQPNLNADLYKLWSDNTGNASGGAPPVVTSAVSNGPVGPNGAVNFNDAGVWGGVADVLEDKNGKLGVYGVETTPAALAISRINDAFGGLGFTNLLALINKTAGDAKAFTIGQDDGGVSYLQADGQINVLSNGAQLFQGEAGVTLQADYGTSKRIFLRAVAGAYGLAPAVKRITGNATIDSGVGGGGSPDFAIYHVSASNHTLTLDTLANSLFNVVFERLLFVENAFTGGYLTIDANGSETIGQSNLTVTLGPGWSAILHAWSGTSPIWNLLALNRAPFVTTLTDAQTKALPTTAIQILGDPPSGLQPNIDKIVVRADTTSGAYTNVNTVAGKLFVRYRTSGTLASSYVGNDSTLTPTRTYLTTLLTAAAKRNATLREWIDTVETNQWGNLASVDADESGHGLEAFLNNNGSGNLTGGNSANTLTFETYYTLENAA